MDDTSPAFARFLRFMTAAGVVILVLWAGLMSLQGTRPLGIPVRSALELTGSASLYLQLAWTLGAGVVAAVFWQKTTMTFRALLVLNSVVTLLLLLGLLGFLFGGDVE